MRLGHVLEGERRNKVQAIQAPLFWLHVQQTRTISHTLRTCKQQAGPQQASGAHGALPPGQPVITLAVEGSVGLAKSSGIVQGLLQQFGPCRWGK